ncbi:uncharacterized protein LOC113464778 [Ceratina calcarata]|uniref:Uncharacterized protein LOC113464778 n=1 Tax=Ceratina calcarata TaxID=156304 RepID=A0AAJ7WDH1_9HYME|nr:uncharacterized protein LOC113464778 [Ceratina calcarata]
MSRKTGKVRRKPTKKKLRKIWPTKIAALIVSAIQDLGETKGPTPSKIIDYISYTSDMADMKVKRRVKAALKKGVEFGILKKYRGHYFLPVGDEIDRANRVALRFSKLPLPRKIAVLGSKRRSAIKSRNRTKRLKKYRSPLLSSTVSIANAICQA